MARFGDRGAYIVGNVKIVTREENMAERVFSVDARAKIGAAASQTNTGRKHSTGARANMSAAHKNLSTEARANMSASHIGHVVSAETRAKISATLSGKPRSASNGIAE